MIIQIIMTESTGYLDMNKKPVSSNQLSFVLFFKKGIFVFQTEPNSIDRSIAPNPKKTSQPNPQETLFNPLSPTRFDPKKKFPCFFQKKTFFPPRPGFELTLKKILVSPTARAKRAIPARPPAARCPPLLLPPALAAAAAHVDMRSETRDECILPRHRKITDEAFFGSRKDASVWQREKLIFSQIYSSLSPTNPRLYKQNDDS